jgi:hypothetical protein
LRADLRERGIMPIATAERDRKQKICDGKLALDYASTVMHVIAYTLCC